MKQETQKKQLPLVIFTNEPAIKNDRRNLENLVEVISEFSTELERDEVLLDDQLLDQFMQVGPGAIADRIVENADTGMAMSMLRDQMFAGARRTAHRYGTYYRKIESAIHKAGVGPDHIAMLNGRPSLRGSILDEIKRRHTIFIDNSEDLELFEKLTEMVSTFNDLRDWMKENRPEMTDLVSQTITALTEHFHDGNEIASGDYLINKPNAARDDISLMVNPLFFG